MQAGPRERAETLLHALIAPPRVTDLVLQESGTGTFGKVFRCRAGGSGAEVAIKVIRGVDRYAEAAEVEARILTLVNRADPQHESRCVRFLHTFVHDGRTCMVFELLGPSVYDYLQKNRFNPLPLFVVQALADQLVWSVAYLHAMQLVHTDLKPENMLFEPTTFVESFACTGRRERRAVLTPTTTAMRCACWGKWGLPIAAVPFATALCLMLQ